MCIRDRRGARVEARLHGGNADQLSLQDQDGDVALARSVATRRSHHGPHADLAPGPVSYTHLRANETVLDLVCRLLLEKKQYTHGHTTKRF